MSCDELMCGVMRCGGAVRCGVVDFSGVNCIVVSCGAMQYDVV